MPSPDVMPDAHTVGIRYQYADGTVHIWTVGIGCADYSVRLLRNDPGDPVVNLMRWSGTEWEHVPDDWPFGARRIDEFNDGEWYWPDRFEDDDDFYRYIAEYDGEITDR